MDLIADENQHPAVVAYLRTAGHAVEWIFETSPGAKDEDILARPDIDRKILITYDRDFGDLIFNQGYPAPYALLYTRLSRAEPAIIAARLTAILDEGISPGHIITLDKNGARLRPFPTGAKNA